MTEPLPALLDCKALQRELCITRAAAEAVMRQLPIVSVPGLRKVYVRRDDVQQALEAWTYGKDQVTLERRRAFRLIKGGDDG